MPLPANLNHVVNGARDRLEIGFLVVLARLSGSAVGGGDAEVRHSRATGRQAVVYMVSVWFDGKKGGCVCKRGT